MMKSFQHSRVLIVLLALVICVSACKSSKKAAEAARAAEEKARIEREATAKKEDEARKRQEAEEKATREAQVRQEPEKESAPAVKLNQYFEAISGSTSATAANNSIQEALGLFASEDTPVLIVISGTGDQKDYDKPTTIKKYLNYLKDQKKNINRIANLQLDSSGKITEVELSKN